MPTPKPSYPTSQQWSLDDVLEITVEGENEGTPWAAVRHYRISATLSNDDESDIVEAHWRTTILPAMAALLTDKWSAQCASVSRVAPVPRDVDFFPWTAIPGEVTSDGVPNGTALVMKLRTNATGPRNRGRMYIPGLPEASTNAGLLTAAVRTAWDGVGALLAANIGTGGNTLVPVVFSRTNFLALPNPFNAAQYDNGESCSSIIVNGQAVGNLGSQRDRRYRRNTFG